MNLKKNDKIELFIDAVTSEGSGIGRYNGFAVFVRGTVPGDKIRTHIIKISKNYAIGIIDEILEPSPERIESDCPVSKMCGGCSLRNMSYQEELNYKLSRVQEAVSRIGNIDFPVERIIGAETIKHYRNKAQYPVLIENGILTAGFYAYKSHRIIPCADCLLQPADFEKGLAALSKWIEKNQISSYDEKSGRGLLRHIYFRKAFGTDEIMACAVVNASDIPDKEYLISLLQRAFDNLKSVVININKMHTNVILGSKTKTIWGSDKICDILLGKKFVVSPQSFYQVNHSQCERLYSLAAEYANLKGGETVVDLYCGAGTIGLTLADKCRKLVGIELVPSAIENARENAALNGIKNAEFICADAFDGARQMEQMGLKPDLVILDPPRKGCQKELFDVIEAMGAGRIVYVSCDSATLARDLAVLKEKGWQLCRLAAVDMFPRTPHVEAVALVTKL